MIKCIWFWKLLKQFFIISLISCFILLVGSSVKARTYYPTWTGANDYLSWLAFQPVWDREYLMNYGLLVDEDWDFDTFYNSWYSQLVMYYPPYSGGYTDWWRWTHIYGWIDWKLYYYWDYDWPYNWPFVRQWFIKNFMHTTKDLLLDVNNWPYARWENNLTADEFYSQSHNFSNIYTMSTNGSVNALVSNMFRTFCLEESNWVDVYCWSCSATWTIYDCNSQVENSLNYTINDFDDVFDIPYDFSPFGSPTWNGSWMYWTWTSWPTTWNYNVWLTGDYTYYNCTYGVIIDYAENMWMSKNLCYGWLDNFDLYNSESTYNPVPWTWKTLWQITTYLHSTWSTPNEWFDFWNGLRGGYTSMWESYPAVNKTWFDLYYQYNWNSFDFPTVYEYCTLRVSDVDFENTVYRWQYFWKTCDYIKRNYWDNVYTSWNVIIWINWQWVWDLSWQKVSEPIGYIQDFFNLLKENFPTRSDSWPGALPIYIITFLCAIILFRFISH